MTPKRLAAERHLNDSLWEAVWTATDNNVPPETISMIVLTTTVTVLKTITSAEEIRTLLQLAGELVGEERPEEL